MRAFYVGAILLVISIIFGLIHAAVYRSKLAWNPLTGEESYGNVTFYENVTLHRNSTDVSESTKTQVRPLLHVYLFARNEQVLLPHAVKHYRDRFPNCAITVVDNMSTDNTSKTAERLGCTVIPWDTSLTSQYFDIQLAWAKNSFWKNFTESDAPWVVVADVDEWIDVWSEDLELEDSRGTMILNTAGFNIMGESNLLNLSDIDVHNLTVGVPAHIYSKWICFKRGPKGLQEIDYGAGAHGANPVPRNAPVSQSCYTLKHMVSLGLGYLIEKYRVRKTWLSDQCSKTGMACHYFIDDAKITSNFNTDKAQAKAAIIWRTTHNHSRLTCVH